MIAVRRDLTSTGGNLDMKQHRHPTMAGAFQHAWDLVKALSTEDLRMAARTGGIQMTPERRRAYADAGLPLNTGGGFRTMPETEAEKLIRYQKTGSEEGIGFKHGSIPLSYDPKEKGELADFLQQDLDTGGSLDMDDRLEDLYYMLTQGQSIPGPMEIQEPTVVGTQDVKGKRGYGTRGRVEITPGPRRTVSESAKELSKPFTSTDPPRNPESEFSRRGDAGASPTNQAFKLIQQRKNNAERMKQVQADRQREMTMQRQRDRMKSRTPPQARGRRREGPNQRKMRMKREAERRKNR